MIPGGTGGGLMALGVALVVGVVAGRSKQRFSLLLLGLLVAAVVGFVVVAVSGQPVGGTRPAEIARLYTAAIPLAVAFLAGWLCARGSWFGRLVVIAVAALLLAAFPYAAAGQATAEVLRNQSGTG